MNGLLYVVLMCGSVAALLALILVTAGIGLWAFDHLNAWLYDYDITWLANS